MLGKQLKLLREAKQKSQQEVCSALNIEQSTLANYENGKRIPKIEILIKIAEYYECSIDFLLGVKQSEKTDLLNPETNTSKFALDLKTRIQNLIIENKIPKDEFIKRIGLYNNKIQDYLYGIKISSLSIEDLIIIAKELNVSTDYLLGISELEHITSREYDIVNVFRKLDDDNKDIIVGEMKKYLKEQRHEAVTTNEPLKRTGTDNLGK